jgi:hypothetical protein
MKKITLSVVFLLSIMMSAHATEKRFNLYGGYVFDDDFESYYDYYNYINGKIKGGFQYGAGIEFMVKPDYGVELLYIGQSTEAPIHYISSGYFLEQFNTVDLSLNYALLSGIRYGHSHDGKLEGYGGFMLGALFASATNQENHNSGSGTKFAWGLKLGGNIWATDKIGFKVQGQLLSAVQSVGGSLYLGTGGAGAGVSTYSSMLQFSVSGGLVFRLGAKE